MSMLDGLKDQTNNWLARIAFRKATVWLTGLIVARVMASHLDKIGVTVDPDKLTAEIGVGFVLAHDWLKLKTGWKWL